MQAPQATHFSSLKRTSIVPFSYSKAPTGQTVTQAPHEVQRSSLRETSWLRDCILTPLSQQVLNTFVKIFSFALKFDNHQTFGFRTNQSPRPMRTHGRSLGAPKWLCA